MMINRSISTLMIMALVTGVGSWSCARQERTTRTDSTAVQTEGGVGAVPPGGAGAANEGPDTASSARSDTGAGLSVSGTLAELRSQLRSAAAALDRAVSSRNWAEAASQALVVRDVVVALAGKTSGLPGRNIQRIEDDVTAVTQIVEQIRLHAGAREADAVKAKNTELQSVVADILKLTVAPA